MLIILIITLAITGAKIEIEKSLQVTFYFVKHVEGSHWLTQGNYCQDELDPSVPTFIPMVQQGE